jgi:septal ring-binding cell division protein DamX
VDTAKPRPAATSHAAPAAPGAGTSSLRSYDEMARSFAAHPTGAFTVQFELVCEAPSLTIAIKQGGDEVWFVPIVYRARGCYRVFWGHYATRAEAQRGIAAIPASLRGSNPTVVSVPRP